MPGLSDPRPLRSLCDAKSAGELTPRDEAPSRCPLLRISPRSCPSRIAVPSARSQRRTCMSDSRRKSLLRSRRLENSAARTAASLAVLTPADARFAPTAGACAVTSDTARSISLENVSASVISSSARSGPDASRALMRDFQEDISADDGAAISSPSMVAVMTSPFGGRCGQMEGWSVGVVLAGGAAGRGAVDDAPVPLVLAGGLAPLDLDGVVAGLDAMCAVACRVEVRGAVALAH